MWYNTAVPIKKWSVKKFILLISFFVFVFAFVCSLLIFAYHFWKTKKS